ncbi:sodium:hydrogen antiporter, partial [Achromatium sp. WMS3]
MNLHSILLELTLIIVGAACLGTLFLYAKQPIIIAYIAIGMLLGPHGMALIDDAIHIEQIAHFGVILLLFIIGINLQPSKFIKLFRETSFITLFTSLCFGISAFLFGLLLRFDIHSSLLLGTSMMFSSTVVGLKLIPTTTLHHKRIGEVMTSILLLQDILAIIVIIFVTGKKSDYILVTFGYLIVKFVLLCVLAFAGVRWVVIPLLEKFSIIQEYTFLITLAWCLLWAEVAHLLGISYEMGAFVAGLSIASCPIALVISEHLKPLREFFLILFFFSVGAKLDFALELRLILAAIAFGGILVPLKIAIFGFVLQSSNESPKLQEELPVRLGQSSEFAILIAFSALSLGIIAKEVAMVIQIATLITFIVSTYLVTSKYP